MSMTESEAEMQIIRCIVGACDDTCPHYWLDGVCHGSSEVASCAEKALSELEAYRAIGTVSEFMELKEKATEKKPYYVQYDVNPEIGNYHCPTCEGFVLYTHPICSCGQKLDWSEGKE